MNAQISCDPSRVGWGPSLRRRQASSLAGSRSSFRDTCLSLRDEQAWIPGSFRWPSNERASLAIDQPWPIDKEPSLPSELAKTANNRASRVDEPASLPKDRAAVVNERCSPIDNGTVLSVGQAMGAHGKAKLVTKLAKPVHKRAKVPMTST